MSTTDLQPTMVKLSIKVDCETKLALLAEAKRRGLDFNDFVSDILVKVVNGRLFAAVLD